MAEDAKVDDGTRTRNKKGLRQLRKAREEEKTTRELQKEMQENLEKAHERVLQMAENLWREVEDQTTSPRRSGK